MLDGSGLFPGYRDRQSLLINFSLLIWFKEFVLLFSSTLKPATPETPRGNGLELGKTTQYFNVRVSLPYITLLNKWVNAWSGGGSKIYLVSILIGFG